MIIKVLFAIMICIVIFAFGFCTGRATICSKVYDKMIEALNSVTVEKDGVDCVKGVIYATMKVDEIMTKDKGE